MEHLGPVGCVHGGGGASSSLWESMTWASFQLPASEMAIWTVSSGDVSFPLKSLSFLAFHMNHKIQGTFSRIDVGRPSPFARHRRWLRLLKIEALGKVPGE